MRSKAKEVWKPIPLFPHLMISTIGNVQAREGEPVIIKVQQGYRWVTLVMPDGLRKRHKIAWLMLEAFVGPRPAEHVARHLNDIHTDDRLANLAWGTHADNTADKMRNGHFVPGPGRQKGVYTATEETRRKQSEALKGKPFTPSHKAAVVAAMHKRRPALTKSNEIAHKFIKGALMKDLAAEYGMTVITLKRRIESALGRKIDGHKHRKVYPNKLGDKLTEIVKDWKAGCSQSTIAKKYGVTQAAIRLRLKKLGEL